MTTRWPKVEFSRMLLDRMRWNHVLHFTLCEIRKLLAPTQSWSAPSSHKWQSRHTFRPYSQSQNTSDVSSSFFSPSSGRVRPASAVHRPARRHHCHIHLPSPGRAWAPAHLAEEWADPGARGTRQTQEQQQVCAKMDRLDSIISCLVTFVSVCYEKLSCQRQLFKF